MSETITVGTGSETIHGTYDDAVAYVDIMYGDAYAVWSALTPDNQKKTLAAAVRYLNAQTWNEDADTFAERDALEDDDGRAIFEIAEYELAVLIASDASILQALDSGSNIRSVEAGGASVEYFAPTQPGRRATKLPPIIQRLVGTYLSVSSTVVVAGYANTGNCESEFSECSETDREDPY